MSKFPRKKAEWVGKALGLCLVLWVFSAMGIVVFALPLSAHASNQNQAHALDVPIPTNIVPPLPTLQPVPTLALDPAPADTPTPTPTNTPEPAATDTPAPIPTPTHISTPISRPTHTTSEAKATPVPTHIAKATQASTSVASPTQAPQPASTPTPAMQPTIQPTASVQAVLPATNQITSTPQPAYSKPTPNVTDTSATPTPSHQPSTPTTQRDQGLFTTLIVTGGISATTLLTAGVVFGIQKQKIQIRRKRKQGETLIVPTYMEQSQNTSESSISLASSPHLIDQDLMQSPIMQDILQASPALFLANEAKSLPTDIPKQIPTQLTEMETQEIPIPQALLNELKSIDEQDTESMAAIEKLEDTAPLPSLPQDLRTDPVLNAVRKQALMGIFVLLGQEKTENVATKEHESEEHTT